MIIFFIFSIATATLSFWGGLWLWKYLSPVGIKKLNISVGAVALFFLCFSITLFIAEQIFVSKTAEGQLGYQLIFLNFSILYNLGYLLSISPNRKNKSTFSNYFYTGILFPICLTILIFLVYQALGKKITLVPIVSSTLAGCVAYISGFVIWKKIRQADIFNDISFRNTLWYLSLGFVVMCIVILLIGILSFKIPALLMVSSFLILLIFISLDFYCLGLIYALKKSARV